ncbi:MAG: hypothetical protein M3P27_04285 [Acidobacteriota bacterium]|nr:hypothetical protein [Acidobacteriota bacterium]
MVSLASLWLPILLASVIVFIASSIMHTVLKYHHSDVHRLPDEENVRAALRGLARGFYMVPYCDHKDMKSPEMQERFKQGPIAHINVMANGPVNMGKFLGQWFGFLLIVNFFVAYLAAHTLPFGANYLVVFRVVGTAAFLAYGLANLANGIWKAQGWGMTIKEVMDGLFYGLLVAGTFGWLWPR